MKASILPAAVIMTGLVAISGTDRDISGTWVMQQGDSRLYPPVLRISMNKGTWEGRLDITEQQVYDLEVSSIKVERDSVFIKVYENGPVTRARMTSDSTITGSRTWEGRTDIVELKKK